ncbi:ABC transporter ATP-binding protein [Solibacillus sp. MA9]|uniref:ABC transporter ATP-binding protein n=1 Tax=Solibacillus palustris TaxID=2908203 RepID=A0ABS9UAZ9_9BACL|nr:ABC transporter ATP-binding protein [Solibacillus sp. MA9]MCH7321527.1 ABC transporter ATP-binding protein [Solibacillus sp. MA9]
MEAVIKLNNVSKRFSGFEVKDLSFEVKKGFVTGFVGANGMGKSTTIKLIMNLLQPDKGEVSVFGLDYQTHEREIKQRIGFVFDEHVFYENLTLLEMKKIIEPAYDNWDEGMFQRYVDEFQLPLKKKLKTFSKGMQMKASLAIALSHHADLIIMDEPTAGLDPVFRRELLSLLRNIVQDSEKTIFFSTHITSDLDRIADYIVFIHEGQLIFTQEFYKLEQQYVLVKGGLDLLDSDTKKSFIALQQSKHGFEGLSADKTAVMELFGDLAIYEPATLEDILYYTKKGTKEVAATN